MVQSSHEAEGTLARRAEPASPLREGEGLHSSRKPRVTSGRQQLAQSKVCLLKAESVREPGPEVGTVMSPGSLGLWETVLWKAGEQKREGRGEAE